MSYNFEVESGNTVKFPVGGKYCDRDIVVTATGGGAGGIGPLTKYTKIIAKPESTTSFTIQNPLGGIAKKVFVRAISEATTSADIRKYIADYELGIGVIELASSDGTIRRYTSVRTDYTPNNGEFAMSDGIIKLYRFNASNDWDIGADYEVEIYE